MGTIFRFQSCENKELSEKNVLLTILDEEDLLGEYKRKLDYFSEWSAWSAIFFAGLTSTLGDDWTDPDAAWHGFAYSELNVIFF